MTGEGEAVLLYGCEYWTMSNVMVQKPKVSKKQFLSREEITRRDEMQVLQDHSSKLVEKDKQKVCACQQKGWHREIRFIWENTRQEKQKKCVCGRLKQLENKQ